MKALVTELQEQAEKIRLGKYDSLDFRTLISSVKKSVLLFGFFPA